MYRHGNKGTSIFVTVRFQDSVAVSVFLSDRFMMRPLFTERLLQSFRLYDSQIRIMSHNLRKYFSL